MIAGRDNNRRCPTNRQPEDPSNVWDKDRIYTLMDVSTMFNVSIKTISRWRDAGLVASEFSENGRRRIGFSRSSLKQFISHHSDRVRRGSTFRRMSAEERDRIIALARNVARDAKTTSEMIHHLAKQTGRSTETIRYTLKQHDNERPNEPILTQSVRSLPDDHKRFIYEQFRRGHSAKDIAKRMDLSVAKVRRCIREMRIVQIQELPLEYIASQEFEQDGCEKRILQCKSLTATTVRRKPAPAKLPAYLASFFDTPLLSVEQELHLFRKYNFLKYQAAKLRSQLDTASRGTSWLDQIERLYDEAVDTKNQIIQANLRLVVSIVKARAPNEAQLHDLLSNGNVSLMRAVEKFDYTRGFKFSTYATWAITRNSARDHAQEMMRLDRFKTSRATEMIGIIDTRSDPQSDEAAQRQRASQVARLLNQLNDCERQVISSRFGLQRDQEPKSLKDIGTELGMTRLRVRQIAERAMRKLREAAANEGIELVD